MKRLFLMLISVCLLASCDPSSFRVEKGSQNGGGGLGAGKDVTNILISHFRNSSALLGNCQLASTSPMLWIRPMFNGYTNTLNYSAPFYSDNGCTNWVAELALEFDYSKIVTVDVEDEYLMQIQLSSVDLYIDDQINYAPEDFHDFSANLNEFFFWRIKIDSAVIDSDISMPTYQEITQPSSESSPIMTSEMFYISRGG